jgi:hypothetical protein
MTEGEARDAGTQTGSGDAPPENAGELMAEIERTREELGDTVEALAAKADVKARAQQRAAEVSGQLKDRVDEVKAGMSSRAGQLKGELTGKAGQLKGQLTGKVGQTRQAVTDGSKTVLGASQPTAQRLSQRAAQTGTSAWQAAPDPVQNGARRVARTVNQHRVPSIAIAAGASLLAGWLAFRWLRR